MSLRDEIEEKIALLQSHLDELNSIDEDYKCETMAKVFSRVDRSPRLPKISTGIDIIDTKLGGGLSLGTFINIAGENFAGKTTLVLNIMFFSFEMYEVILREKMADWDISQLNNLYVEQKRNTLSQIEKIIRGYAKDGVKLFCIDSRMKIIVERKLEEYQKNSLISQRLSKLSQELGITIILINQVAEADLRSNRLALKGSGDQAYDSDVIFYVKADINKETGEIEKRTLICSKDRVNGKKWAAQLPVFDAPPVEIEYKVEVPQL
jgi:replicative DNA helicase